MTSVQYRAIGFFIGKRGIVLQKYMLKSWKTQCLLAIVGVGVGVATGIVIAIFGNILLWISAFRDTHIKIFLPFLAVFGLGLVATYRKWGGRSNEGMGLVLSVGQRKEQDIPLRLIPFSIVSTWLTHLFGGSAGREGVAVQIGATVSHHIGKRFDIEDNRHIFLLTGMAAGFAALFQTPIAAIFFAMEILVVGKWAMHGIVPMITAALTACFTGHMLGIKKFHATLTGDISFTPHMILCLVLLGLLFGVAGKLFVFALRYIKKYTTKYMPNPYWRIFLGGMMISILIWVLHDGRYTGLGTNLIAAAFANETIYPYDWICKLVLTAFTLSIGFQGGEVTPSFAIGAALGVVLAKVFGLPVLPVAALGFVTVFGSATNTLFAPILVGCELFGFVYLPYFMIVCLAMHLLCCMPSIYSQQQQYTYTKTIKEMIFKCKHRKDTAI